MDKHLRWYSHISYLCNRLRKIIYKFVILRNVHRRGVILVSLPSTSAAQVRFPAESVILILTLGLERGPPSLVITTEQLLDISRENPVKKPEIKVEEITLR